MANLLAGSNFKPGSVWIQRRKDEDIFDVRIQVVIGMYSTVQYEPRLDKRSLGISVTPETP